MADPRRVLMTDTDRNQAADGAHTAAEPTESSQPWQVDGLPDQLFHRLMERLPIGVTINRVKRAGDPGSITMEALNPAANKAVRADMRPLLGMALQDHTPEAVQSAAAKANLSALKTGERLELPALHMPATEHFREAIYRYTVVPLEDDVTATLFEDVTDREEALEDLRIANRALEDANTELSRFTHAVSHDIREPLRTIVGFIDLLNMQLDDISDEAKQSMTFINEAAARMEAQIKGLLELSRLQSRPVVTQPVDLVDTVEGVMASLRETIERHDAEVRVSNMPVVQAEPALLASLLQNLISNALKYGDVENPRIDIASHTEGRTTTVTVRDNGIGIDKRHHKRVFEVFRRLHPAHKYEGIGMGLALCQRIVWRYGGKIWVESAPGEGTAVHFTLPVGGRRPSGRTVVRRRSGIRR